MVWGIRSTQPLVWGRPARMKRWRVPRVAIVCWKLAERNSWALSLITRSSCQPRAARSAATVPARALVQTAEGYAE
jgi:hypothetical protein